MKNITNVSIVLLTILAFCCLDGCGGGGGNDSGIPGPNGIVFTSVPRIGTWGEPLKGKVSNDVSPSKAKIIVFIKVGSTWWVKPFYSTPFTTIGSNHTWSCYITTGGIDEQATEIRAYLVSSDYDNSSPLPPNPPTSEVWAMASVIRSP